MFLKCEELNGWKYREVKEQIKVIDYHANKVTLDDAWVETIIEVELHMIKKENIWTYTTKKDKVAVIKYESPIGEWFGMITTGVVYILNDYGQTIERIN